MMYPVMLNISSRKCVVIGGGSVARRKAEKLKSCGGNVTVISPEFKEGFDGFDTIRKEYDKSDISDAFLVTAATDDRELNRRITSDARSLKILAYAADDASASDFILPASASEGDITVAASTNGKYPFLAKKLRDEISANISFYNSLLPLLEKYRKEIIAECGDNKKDILHSLISDDMLETAKTDIAEFERKIKQHIDKFRAK